MKPSILLSTAWLVTVLCQCSSLPKNTVSIDQYKSWENAPALKAREFRISSRIEERNGDTLQLPTLTGRAGQQMVVTATKEFIYPEAFDLPISLPMETGEGDGDHVGPFPITPSTPTVFNTRDIGDVFTITARPKGAFVELQGSFVTTTATVTSRGAGEAVSPISDTKKRYLFTENKVSQPEFKTTESLLYSAGLPASEQRISLGESGRTLVIKCEVTR
ncbi:MAG TPA: hypothetical protein VLE43_06310, partial [Candidatus Saccharimonadia bacterium]|nr:hypothetical protein [Candidatus Saccharimonadia bacterium]